MTIRGGPDVQFLLAFLFYVVLTHPASSSVLPGAPQSSDPVRFVTGLCEKIVGILKAPQNDRPRMTGRFQKIIGEAFDVSHMARSVLGQRWGEIEEAERAEFESLLPGYLATVYAGLLSQYAEKSLSCGDGHRVSGSDRLIGIDIDGPSASPVPVVFHVLDAGGGWKVVDVVLSGYSLIRLKRAEFAAVIQWSGMDRLLARLRE